MGESLRSTARMRGWIRKASGWRSTMAGESVTKKGSRYDIDPT